MNNGLRVSGFEGTLPEDTPNTFGDSCGLLHALGVMSFAGGTIAFYDSGHNLVSSTALTIDGTFPPCPTHTYGGDMNGISHFTITGAYIEGNTSTLTWNDMGGRGLFSAVETSTVTNTGSTVDSTRQKRCACAGS